MVQVRFVNDTTPIEVTNETQETQIGVQSETQIKSVGIKSGGLHEDLTGRDLENQHPMSAITGLQEALDTIPTDYVSDAELEAALLEKQDVLTAGANIQIVGNTISATDTTYTAGTGIEITNNVISCTQQSAEWGNITGTLSDQTDLNNALSAKYDASNPNGYTSNIGTVTSVNNTSPDVNGNVTLSIPAAQVNSDWNAVSGVAEILNKPSLATVATTGAYSDLTGTPTIPTVNNATLTIQKNSTNVGTFTANASSDTTINITVPTTASDVSALPSSTKYGSSLSLSINSSTYVITAQLKDQDGNNLGSAQTIDLPLESVVVSGSYDDQTKKIILTLQSGSTVEFSVADLVSGLQTEITAQNMLDSDLVDDSTSTNKFVTSSEKSAIGTAVQPSDLATVATTGAYSDLSGTPTIPAAQIQSDWTQADNTKVDFIKNKPTLATVATTGSYTDLSNKPTIPTDTSDLTNGAGFITSSALSGYQTTANLVTSVSSSSTDSQYPSAKCLYDIVGNVTALINAL